MGYNANLQWYCSQADSLRLANQQHWTIVGEFTRKSLLTPYSCMRLTSAAANTDCAKWLNGRGTGARYDNTLDWAQRWVLVLRFPCSNSSLPFKGDCSIKTGADGSKFGAEYTDHLLKSFETQTWVYEQASGGTTSLITSRTTLLRPGWIMWTWKTEQAADWSMATGITYGERM